LDLLFYSTKSLPWLRGHRNQAENQDLRLAVQSPAMLATFKPQIEKKINVAPSVRIKLICSDNKHKSMSMAGPFKGVDHPLTSDKPNFFSKVKVYRFIILQII